ncbi:MAG TPA: hypothetical protein VNS79_02375 [Sphingobium sp.]|nr:hypothetical protein [Sphingobium sp.]
MNLAPLILQWECIPAKGWQLRALIHGMKIGEMRSVINPSQKWNGLR